MNRYMIGTGYCATSKTPIPARSFFEVWHDNTVKHARPEKIVVVTCQGAKLNVQYPGCIEVPITGDLGHIRDIHEGKKQSALSGWAGSMLVAAMVAYCDEKDFIYKEQDCLAFGPWVEQLYYDMGDGMAAIGRGLQPPHHKLKSSQSLFIVRHAYIWQFVRDYLNEGKDNCFDNYGEVKFFRMHVKKPNEVRIQSDGWNLDRDRPMNWDWPMWAAQQWTPAEYEEACRRNLVATP